MSAPAVRAGRLLRLVLMGLVLASTGCAGLLSSYDTVPGGMSRQDDELRRMLVRGDADAALAKSGRNAAPDDELLRALYHGILAHYAGAYESSDSALDRATELAEDRYTKRISRTALSMITSDHALPFEPGRTERLLIHYYGALNRLFRDDLEGAAVEARRLAFLLELERHSEPSRRTAPTLAFLHSFASLIFDAAGDRNASGVARRNALALRGEALSSLDTVPLPDTLGEVVVILEEGFVAHRTEQSLIVTMHPVETERLTDRDDDTRAAAAASVAARIIAAAGGETHDIVYRGTAPRPLHIDLPLDRSYAEACRASDRRENGRRRRGADDCVETSRTPYILRIAWPVYQEDPTASWRSWSVVTDELTEPVGLVTDISSSVIDDFGDERTGMLARMVARSATKLALTKGIERSLFEHDEVIARLLGVLTNLSTAVLEQADTRSWQLLPGRLGIARLRLPPGTHTLSVRSKSFPRGARFDLGEVEIRAGETTFLSQRVWR